jgi:hypothetical protein
LSRWSQFLALVVGHVGQRHSLRDIESALMNDSSLRYHLSTRSVSPSALARGNEKLNADFFQELFGLLYTRLQSSGSVPGKRFRFKGKLFSLDGSLIDLSMKVFPWADIAPKKAAFKLQLGLIMTARSRPSPRSVGAWSLRWTSLGWRPLGGNLKDRPVSMVAVPAQCWLHTQRPACPFEGHR